MSQYDSSYIKIFRGKLDRFPKLNMKKIIGVIPARWASTRFEGKVLAELQGKPMIQHVWQQAKKSRLLKDVIIACDDKRVFQIVEEFGATVVMTSPDHVSGTDRIAAVVKNIPKSIPTKNKIN